MAAFLSPFDYVVGFSPPALKGVEPSTRN